MGFENKTASVMTKKKILVSFTHVEKEALEGDSFHFNEEYKLK